MPKLQNLIAFILLLVASSPSFSFSSKKVAADWYSESNDWSYYYVEFAPTKDNLQAFYGLILSGQWQLDISGHSSSIRESDVRVRARLKQPRSENGSGLSSKSLPFPQSKSWYDRVLVRSPYSYQLEGTGQEISEFITSEIKSGAKLGFIRVSSDTSISSAFYQTVTFYRN